jgi:hypothetical protein
MARASPGLTQTDRRRGTFLVAPGGPAFPRAADAAASASLSSALMTRAPSAVAPALRAAKGADGPAPAGL